MSNTVGWTLAEMPDLTGRRALVTGATSGIGEQTALELARHGAEVLLAARSEDKLDRTEKQIRMAAPDAQLHRVRLDLASFASVRRAAANASRHGPLDLLVNNAGVMATPYARSVDGYELQFATNHLGPFLLTGLLLPQLAASGAGRIVSVSSSMHRIAPSAALVDPHRAGGRYSRWAAYARSKLADLLFVFELDRRTREAGLPVKALAAHPGFAATGLMTQGRGHRGELLRGVFALLGQPAELGALPTLMAATAELPGSTYVGPSNLGQMRGLPRVVDSRRLAHDRDVQRRLWELSEQATGLSYP